jgi:outer membrane autotransporter protein
LRLDWSVLSIDGYTETSSDTLALRVNEQSISRTRLSIGAQADWALSATVKPFLSAFWGHDSKKTAVNTTATFVSGGNAFHVEDANFDSSSYLIGVGVNIFSASNLSGTLSYEYGNSDDVESNMFQGKLLWRF